MGQPKGWCGSVLVNFEISPGSIAHQIGIDGTVSVVYVGVVSCTAWAVSEQVRVNGCGWARFRNNLMSQR